MRTISQVPIGRLRDELLGRGVSALTLDDLAHLSGLTRGASREAMRRARSAGHFFAAAPGLYIPIPPEFSAWGVIPALDVIDQMMGLLGRSYLRRPGVGSGTTRSGSPTPQAFPVMVDRAVRDRDIERVTLRFFERARLKDVPTEWNNSRTPQVRVPSPEATIFDLVDVAYLYPLAVARRTGWLLDLVAGYANTPSL